MLTLMHDDHIASDSQDEQEQEAQLTVFKPNGQFGFTGMFHRRIFKADYLLSEYKDAIDQSYRLFTSVQY